MTNQEILSALSKINVYKTKLAIFLKNHCSALFAAIFENTKFLDDNNPSNWNITFQERLYCIENNITERRLCKICKKNVVPFRTDSRSYREHCCVSCSNLDNDVDEKKKELAKMDGIEEFLQDLPHAYYDEYNLHGFLISECKEYEKAVKYVEALLPYVDNWATCDLLSPKVFKKNHIRLEQDIMRWMASDHTYTIRFGIEMVMSHFLDKDYDANWLERVSVIRSEEYYVNMMIAWFFATALAKQWDDAVVYLENQKLDLWVHNKTIRKAVESYRITDEQKAYLRTLRVK